MFDDLRYRGHRSAAGSRSSVLERGDDHLLNYGWKQNNYQPKCLGSDFWYRTQRQHRLTRRAWHGNLGGHGHDSTTGSEMLARLFPSVGRWLLRQSPKNTSTTATRALFLDAGSFLLLETIILTGESCRKLCCCLPMSSTARVVEVTYTLWIWDICPCLARQGPVFEPEIIGRVRVGNFTDLIEVSIGKVC